MPTNLAAKKRSYANYLGFADAEGGAPAQPENTIAPALTGDEEVGGVLSVDDGTWTGNPLPVSFVYRWFADGVMIAGEDGATYTVNEADLGAVIHARVYTTTTTGGGMADSNATAAITEPVGPEE